MNLIMKLSVPRGSRHSPDYLLSKSLGDAGNLRGGLGRQLSSSAPHQV